MAYLRSKINSRHEVNIEVHHEDEVHTLSLTYATTMAEMVEQISVLTGVGRANIRLKATADGPAFERFDDNHTKPTYESDFDAQPDEVHSQTEQARRRTGLTTQRLGTDLPYRTK